jgi:hypothetical protein
MPRVAAINRQRTVGRVFMKILRWGNGMASRLNQ